MNDQKSLRDLTAPNLATWNERAAIHVNDKTGFYAIDRFRNGEDIMFPIESSEVGCVAQKKLLHLQCHIGLEALCLARRGAFVSGLDFSSSSINAARMLAREAKIDAHFVQADIYDATRVLGGGFDIVYISWGSLNWLPDIWRWGQIVAAMLARSGYVYIIEQHPFISLMKEREGEMTPAFAYRTPTERPIITDMRTSYNEDAASLKNTRMHEWNHSLSDIISSLLEAGLELEFLHEHETISWRRLPMMVPTAQRLFRLPLDHVPLPLSFSLKARKNL